MIEIAPFDHGINPHRMEHQESLDQFGNGLAC